MGARSGVPESLLISPVDTAHFLELKRRTLVFHRTSRSVYREQLRRI
jgi:hypothetical protein